MKPTNSEQFIRVLKNHYLLHKTQKEIAKAEGLSTATVSRMINKAIDLGYVTFSLHLPLLNVDELEDKIKNKFNIKHVSVTKIDIDNEELIARDVSRAVAEYLNRIICEGDIIGVSWGNTLSKVTERLIPLDVSGITVVGLNGGVSKNTQSTGSEIVIQKFAENYGGEGYVLPVPSVVDNSQIAEMIRSDSQIQEIMSMGRQARILIFSIGCIREDSVLLQAGYFSKEEYRQLKQCGFVGDICSHYFKKDGSFQNDELYNRVIGIRLEELRSKECKICVAMDEKKAEGIYGALQGGYIDCLFIDEKTALKLLEVE